MKVESVDMRTPQTLRLMKNLQTLSLATLLLSLAAFSPPAFAQSAGISGERCYARIVRVRQALTLSPNQVGSFPEIAVRGQSPISIQVIYPAGLANEKVSLTALEGGNLGNGLATQDVTLDSLETATFTFATGGGRGLYRVLVRKGTDQKMLEFWGANP